MFQCQQLNEERLERTEAGLRKHTALEEKERLLMFRPSQKFKKKVYEDQFSFNLGVVDHLRRALDSEDSFKKEYEINEGINKIMKRNKRLMLADRHGWAAAETYERDPIAGDSSDEKRIKRAKKETQSFLEEKARTEKIRVMSRKRNFGTIEVQEHFQMDSHSQMRIHKRPDLSPLHVGAVSTQATLQDSAKHQSPQTQLNREDHRQFCPETKSWILKLDFNDFFEQGNFCSDAEFVDSNDKSIIFPPSVESSPNVKDRLSKNIEFWREIGASFWVLKVLEEGYAISFLGIPPRVSFKTLSLP